MRFLLVLGSVAAAALLFAMPANASTVTDNFSGTLGGNAVSGTLTLDVVGGQAQDGTGIFTGFGLVDVPIVLITTSTPDNETTGGPGTTGFRANDGTDYFGADTVYPPDVFGLLFDVNTSSPVFRGFPLLDVGTGTNESAFTGIVGGTEFYNQIGTLDLTPTPLPATAYLFMGGLGFLGFVSYRRKRTLGGDLVGAAA